MTTKAEHAKLLRQNRHKYPQMLEAAGGKCEICGRPPLTRKLHIDHSHRQMKIRGLLCFQCNRVIKSWMDKQWFANASKYMDKYD